MPHEQKKNYNFPALFVRYALKVNLPLSKMQKKRWQQIEDIFNRAAEVPAAERQKFIENLCREDEDLCREVLSLIEADGEEENILDETVFSIGARLLDSSDD